MAFKINATTRIDNSRNITGVGITGTAFVGIFPVGTAAFFVQTASPTGWTKSTTHNDKCLRIVNGAASSGGTVAFSTCYSGSVSVGGTVNGTSLSAANLPSHGHDIFYDSFAGDRREIMATRGGDGDKYGADDAYSDASDYGARAYGQNVGSSSAHSHSFSGTALNMAIQYVDCIIATKD
jgi:hypothetical protein